MLFNALVVLSYVVDILLVLPCLDKFSSNTNKRCTQLFHFSVSVVCIPIILDVLCSTPPSSLRPESGPASVTGGCESNPDT